MKKFVGRDRKGMHEVRKVRNTVIQVYMPEEGRKEDFSRTTEYLGNFFRVLRKTLYNFIIHDSVQLGTSLMNSIIVLVFSCMYVEF
jgi:hypothetical protein